MPRSKTRKSWSIKWALTAGCFCLLFACDGLAQQTPSPANPVPTNSVSSTVSGGDNGASPFSFQRILTRFEFWLTLLLLAFGCVVVVVEYVLLKTSRATADEALKVFGVTLIIVGTLVLVTAGFGDKQIAPAVGLFGTLTGYLLGKITTSQNRGTEEPKG